MATYYARKAGNINATDVWATTPGGVAAPVTFANGDVLVANSFAIIVNVTTNLGSTGQVRNDTTGGATAGGSYTLSDGVTLTANVFAGTSACVGLSASATASLVGNLTGGGANGRAVSINNAGSTLNITATNLTAGTANDSQAIYVSIVAANFNLTLSGSIAGGSVANNPTIRIDGTGSYTITGNSIGGSLGGAHGILLNNASATLVITGNVTGGSNATAYGLNNVLAANPVIVGQCIGGVSAAGAFNTTTGSITATRAVGNGFGPGSVGLTAAPGIANSGLGVVTIEQLEYGTLGQSPTTGTAFRFKKVGTNVAVFNYCDTAGAKTLIDATTNAAMPTASNVRSGTSYASGALVGTLAVPLPSQVAVGVATDNTTGTAALTPADIWSYATRTITGGTVDTLTNAPTVPSVVQIRQEMDSNSSKLANLDATISSRLAPSGTLATVTTLTNAPTVPSASVIASQVRTELSVELGRVDAAISTRATPANIPTADITAIKAKTDALNATRLAECTTTEILGNLLAQANS